MSSWRIFSVFFGETGFLLFQHSKITEKKWLFPSSLVLLYLILLQVEISRAARFEGRGAGEEMTKKPKKVGHFDPGVFLTLVVILFRPYLLSPTRCERSPPTLCYLLCPPSACAGWENFPKTQIRGLSQLSNYFKYGDWPLGPQFSSSCSPRGGTQQHNNTGSKVQKKSISSCGVT